MMNQSEKLYCARQARARDYDRYLVAIAAPGRCRNDLFALLAFADELSRVRDAVTEPALGDIRLAWWRQAIDEAVLETPKDHPVVQGLAAAIRGHELDASWLQGMIDGHGRDLDDKAFTNLEELDAYADATAGNLARLMIAVLGDFPEAVGETAARVGTAWGLTMMLRGHRQQGNNWRGRGHALIADPLTGSNILRRIEDHLIAARGKAKEIPAKARPVLLTAALCDLYVVRLRDGADNAVDLYISPLRRVIRVMGSRLLGRY